MLNAHVTGTVRIKLIGIEFCHLPVVLCRSVNAIIKSGSLRNSRIYLILTFYWIKY